MRSPRSLALLVALALVPVLVATLWPLPGQHARHWVSCVICGDHRTADVVLNVILFLPVGAALGYTGLSSQRVVMLGALLSGTVELAQLWIPGRDPSLGDVIFNTAGTAFGVVLATTARSWLFPTRHNRTLLPRGAAVVATALCGVTGALAVPQVPDTPLYAMWKPALPPLETYRGSVLDVTLADIPVPNGPVEGDRVRLRLRAHHPTWLRVRLVAGPPTDGLAPLFAIYDDQQRQILLLGVDGHDLVLRRRTWAAALHFEQPGLRWRDALRGTQRGDTLGIVVAHPGDAYRVALNGHPVSGRPLTIGSGWAFLQTLPSPFGGVPNLLWTALIFLPAGFWLRTRRDTAFIAAALLAGLWGVPAAAPLLPTPAGEWTAAIIGVLAGVASHALLARRVGRASPAPWSRAGPQPTASES